MDPEDLSQYLTVGDIDARYGTPSDPDVVDAEAGRDERMYAPINPNAPVAEGPGLDADVRERTPDETGAYGGGFLGDFATGLAGSLHLPEGGARLFADDPAVVDDPVTGEAAEAGTGVPNALDVVRANERNPARQPWAVETGRVLGETTLGAILDRVVPGGGRSMSRMASAGRNIGLGAGEGLVSGLSQYGSDNPGATTMEVAVSALAPEAARGAVGVGAGALNAIFPGAVSRSRAAMRAIADSLGLSPKAPARAAATPTPAGTRAEAMGLGPAEAFGPPAPSAPAYGPRYQPQMSEAGLDEADWLFNSKMRAEALAGTPMAPDELTRQAQAIWDAPESWARPPRPPEPPASVPPLAGTPPARPSAPPPLAGTPEPAWSGLDWIDASKRSGVASLSRDPGWESTVSMALGLDQGAAEPLAPMSYDVSEDLGAIQDAVNYAPESLPPGLRNRIQTMLSQAAILGEQPDPAALAQIKYQLQTTPGVQYVDPAEYQGEE